MQPHGKMELEDFNLDENNINLRNLEQASQSRDKPFQVSTGPHPQHVANGREGQDYEAVTLSLRERLSEKELELLEFRSLSMKEISGLRKQLRKRENQLIEADYRLRHLEQQAKRDEDALRAEKSHHGSIVENLTEQVQCAVKELNSFREKVKRAESKRLQSSKVQVRLR